MPIEGTQARRELVSPFELPSEFESSLELALNGKIPNTIISTPQVSLAHGLRRAFIGFRLGFVKENLTPE